jgi:non-specific serine/threonine protein kinase
MTFATPELQAPLPSDLTTFIGRRDQSGFLAARLDDGAALVTLFGPGGVGKTRLALHVARGVRANYRTGAQFVNLASVTRADDVAQVVLAALGIPEQRHVPAVERLAAALSRMSLLLVLANCEQVAQPAAAMLNRLLRVCPELHVLATSREVLGVAGEQVVRVAPLRLPSADDRLADIAASEAVELFVSRATASEATFTLTADSATHVARICHLVEGIPLDIELAAARIRSMSPAEIASSLSRRTRGATIDWSYHLLEPEEQVLLRRLAVFAGGCTLKSARRVCSDHALPADHVHELLDRLVARSLLTSVRDRGTRRFQVPDLLRCYLLQRLERADDAEAVRAHLRDWCLSLTSSDPAAVVGPKQLERLRTEEANVRAALRWTLETDQVQAASQLAIGLTSVWLEHGRFAQGRAFLAAVADLASADRHPRASSLASSWGALFAQNEGNRVVMDQLAARGLALALASGDDVAITWARVQAGHAALDRGDLSRAAALYEASLPSAQKSGQLGVVLLRRYCLILLEQGKHARASRALDEAVNLASQLGSRFMEGRLLALHAVVLAQSQLRDALSVDRLLDQAVAAERAAGSVGGLIEVLTTAATLVLERGDLAQAAEFLREAVTLARSYRSGLRLAVVLEAASGVLVEINPAASVRVAAAADALRESLNAVLLPSERRRLDDFERAARSRLGDQLFMYTRSTSRTAPLESAVVEALSLLGLFHLPAGPTLPVTLPDPLTPREREVAILLTRGLNNGEIAAALMVTRKTIEAHIHHIFNKLNVSNRVEVVNWAYERGIVQVAADAVAQI